MIGRIEMCNTYRIELTVSLDCYQIKTYTVYKNDKEFQYCKDFETAKKTIIECLEIEEYNRKLNNKKTDCICQKL